MPKRKSTKTPEEKAKNFLHKKILAILWGQISQPYTFTTQTADGKTKQNTFKQFVNQVNSATKRNIETGNEADSENSDNRCNITYLGASRVSRNYQMQQVLRTACL